jgi:hypothetical protein
LVAPSPRIRPLAREHIVERFFQVIIIHNELVRASGRPAKSFQVFICDARSLFLGATHDRLHRTEILRQLYHQMCMQVRDGSRENSSLQFEKAGDERNPDRSAKRNWDFHRGGGSFLMVAEKARVFSGRGRILVVTGGMDAMPTTSETARASMEPAGVGIDDDMTPAQWTFMHGSGSIGRLPKRQAESCKRIDTPGTSDSEATDSSRRSPSDPGPRCRSYPA